MEAWLNEIIPNVMDKTDELLTSILQTLYMTALSSIIAFTLGLLVGIILILTASGGVMENKVVYGWLDKIINLFRSIPFIILMCSLVPLSRLIVGTGIGPKGAIVPLVIGTIPFYSRQVEVALSDLDRGVIEAALSMGESKAAIVPLVIGTIPFYSRQVEVALSDLDRGVIEAALSMGESKAGLIFRVYLKESIPALVRVTTITIINLISLTAMAGAIGGGGLGDFAIRYGHGRSQYDVTYVTVIIILLITMLIQAIGRLIIKRTTH